VFRFTPIDISNDLQVEYYPAVAEKGEDSSSSSSSSSSSDDDEDDPEDPTAIKDRHLKVKISDDLAALGLYARSMKPQKGWLSQRKSPCL